MVPCHYLAISEQWREVEEERLAERNRLNWVIEVFTFVQLDLESGNKAGQTFEMRHDQSSLSDILRTAYLLGGKGLWKHGYLKENPSSPDRPYVMHFSVILDSSYMACKDM